MNYIKSKYSMYTIVLWTLEANKEARKFYERNKFCDTGKRRTIYRGQNYIQIQYVYHLVNRE